MRRILLYIVMLLYVNSYMFFPSVDETVQYDQYGQQVDAVTSIIEYVDQVMLGHTDNTPDNKHQSEHFHFVKRSPVIQNQFAIVRSGHYYDFPEPAQQFPQLLQQRITLRSYDVAAPPPKA